MWIYYSTHTHTHTHTHTLSLSLSLSLSHTHPYAHRVWPDVSKGLYSFTEDNVEIQLLVALPTNIMSLKPAHNRPSSATNTQRQLSSQLVCILARIQPQNTSMGSVICSHAWLEACLTTTLVHVNEPAAYTEISRKAIAAMAFSTRNCHRCCHHKEANRAAQNRCAVQCA